MLVGISFAAMIEILSQSSVDKILGTPKYIRSYYYKHDSKISVILLMQACCIL